MITSEYQAFLIHDASCVGELRRFVRNMSLKNGLDEATIGRAELVATELGTNLTKHAGQGGEVLVSSFDHGQGIELISQDRGPGMADPMLMLQDGVSTTGTLGGGLGAIRRLSQEFDLHSRPGKGTAILARIWSTNPLNKTKTKSQANGMVEIAGTILPMPGEIKSGDAWAMVERVYGAIVIMIDGLGHGVKAAEAAEECIVAFNNLAHYESSQKETLTQLIQSLHEKLRRTQGVSLAIADVDCSRQKITYAGIGNISGRIIHKNGSTGCVSVPGIVGYQLRKVKEFVYPFERQSLLIMNSDGLLTALDIEGMEDHKVALISGALCSRFRRGTDDAGVVVVRNVAKGTA